MHYQEGTGWEGTLTSFCGGKEKRSPSESHITVCLWHGKTGDIPASRGLRVAWRGLERALSPVESNQCLCSDSREVFCCQPRFALFRSVYCSASNMGPFVAWCPAPWQHCWWSAAWALPLLDSPCSSQPGPCLFQLCCSARPTPKKWWVISQTA